MKKITGLVMALCALCVFGEMPPIFERYDSKTVVYKTVDGQPLDMVLFFPEKKPESPMPVMLYIHGGGWQKGNRFNIFNRPAMDLFLKEGIACASIEYRLVQAGKSTIMDCATDCMDAARFLVKHADEYGFDATRMGTWGSSAGGHLCLLTALAPDELFPGDSSLQVDFPTFRCVVSCFPVTTFTAPEVLKSSRFFKNPKTMGLLFGGAQDEWAATLSPAEYFSSDSPAVLLMHGDQDPLVGHEHSEYALKRAQAAGAQAELVTVTNGMHNFHAFEEREIQPTLDETCRIAADFIIKHLKGES